MDPTLVLYPGTGLGHIKPFVELAKILTARGFRATIVLAEPKQKAAAFFAAVERVVTANPDISFHTLPRPDAFPDAGDKFPYAQKIDMLRAYTPRLREFVASLSTVTAFILDFFCVDALDVADELRVPAYFFFASGADDLAVFLHFPYLRAAAPAPFIELGDTPLHIPGVPPLPASHLPEECARQGPETCDYAEHTFKRLSEGRGFLVNTFESLAPDAVEAVRAGRCVPGRPTKVYCVGPIISGGEKPTGDDSQRHECLSWLDRQPEKSVVFLCFGSVGTFSGEQILELATGLEKSGHRFLWALRSPQARGDGKKWYPELPDPNLDELLPEGFLDRTRQRGMVVKSWAPQQEVLRHSSTGAFVTHCGWNSCLEGINSGVPMICWPLYAEQRINRVVLTDRLRVGVALEGYTVGHVTSDEVAKKVKWVMDSEDGKEMRRRVEATKAAAEAAVKPGGPAVAAVDQFVRDLLCGENTAQVEV